MFPKPLVSDESSALFHHSIIVGFPKHFEGLGPIFTHFPTKFDCIALLQNLGHILLDEGAVDTPARA